MKISTSKYIALLTASVFSLTYFFLIPLARIEATQAQGVDVPQPTQAVKGEKRTSKIYIPTGASSTYMKTSDGEVALLVKDYLTSTKFVESTKGSASQAYLPYGSTNGDSNSYSDKQFTGHRSLEDTGVYHAGARFYNPQLGSFIQSDKNISLANPQDDASEASSTFAKDYSRVNLYKYARNNPLMFVDKDGNDAVLLFDSKSVFGAGHVGMLMADAEENWHYYSWAPAKAAPINPKKRISVARVPESFSYFVNDAGDTATIDPTASLDAFNIWLHESNYDDGKAIYSGTYNNMVRMKGDFSESVMEAYERTKLNSGTSMLNPHNWYTLLSRNCLHECLSLINKGKLESKDGRGTLNRLQEKSLLWLSGRLHVPNASYGLILNRFNDTADMQIFKDPGSKMPDKWSSVNRKSTVIAN